MCSVDFMSCSNIDGKARKWFGIRRQRVGFWITTCEIFRSLSASWNFCRHFLGSHGECESAPSILRVSMVPAVFVAMYCDVAVPLDVRVWESGWSLVLLYR